MNPVLILTRNNLELTKKCVESVRGQDIPTKLYIFDNASSDGTQDWYSNEIPPNCTWSQYENLGVSRGWNIVLKKCFEFDDAEHVLVLNNDTIIPPWFYRGLLSFKLPFVSGVGVDSLAQAMQPGIDVGRPTPNPDFSAFLIRRECWEKVGQFDERMKIYCSDCDYHIRAHRLGVQLSKVNLPYFHINSQTLKRATPEDRAEIEAQAGRDRMVFAEMYGCLPGSPEYEQLFK
jgi:GT2 family glycosyltransferase